VKGINMSKTKPSRKAPKIADAWDMSGLEFGSPEKEIMGRFDLYGDGDWKQAILAAIVALENDLPLPDWARDEVATELRRGIKLKPYKRRPKGRGNPARKYLDESNQQAVVAAVDAAGGVELRGDKKFQTAMDALIQEGVLVGTPESVETIYKTHRKRATGSIYPQLVILFTKEIRKILNQ